MRDRQQSTTNHPMLIYMVLSIDHLTPATGKTVAVRLNKDGAASSGAASGAVTEIDSTNMPGWYSLAGNATDRNTLGSLGILATATGCDAFPDEYSIVGYDPFDSVRLGLTGLPNAAAGVSGGLPTLDTNLSLLSNIEFRGTASAGGNNTITLAGAVATDNYYKYSVVQIVSGTGAGQTPRTIIHYVGSTKVATIAGAWTTNPDNTSVFIILPAARGLFAHSGIAQAGASGSITLSSLASASDNIYNGAVIWIDGGTGIGEQAVITAYNGTTKVATITPTWAVTPDSTSIYHVMSSGRSSVEAIATAVVTSVQSGLATLTKLLKYTQLLMRKDSGIATDNATELTAINANGGSGAGAFDNTTDSEQAIRDNMATVSGGIVSADVQMINGNATAAGVLEANLASSESAAVTSSGYTPTTTSFKTTLTETNPNQYVNRVVRFTSGTLKGQEQRITVYDGSTKVITTKAFNAAPSNGDTFIIP